MASDNPETGDPKPSATAADDNTDAPSEARQASDAVRREVRQLASEAKQHGQSLFEGQRKAAAEDLGEMAQALKRAAQQLHEQQRAATASYAERAAAALESAAGTLREGDFQSLVKKTEDFARRYPGAFLGGSVLAGLLLSRFLKSSAAPEPSATSPGIQSGYTH